MADFFIKVPNTAYLKARRLVSDVNCGFEVFLPDLSYKNPRSLIINPAKPKGGQRLKIGESVLVTNQSMLWLVEISRNKNGYTARLQGNTSRPENPAAPVAPFPQGFDLSLYRKATARLFGRSEPQVLARRTRQVQRRRSPELASRNT